MRSVHIRSVAIAATAILTLAGSVAAQEKPTGLLNSLEVRQLVARAEPADNARLAAHFSALADRYTAEEKRHLSMSQTLVGNPSRNLVTGMSAHCKRLANLNTQSATTVRELAAYYEKLASGTPVNPPRDAARFQGGAAAPEPTEKELNALAANATTPADQRALEEYFLALAKRHASEVANHSAMAQAYRSLPRSPGWAAAAAVHCDNLVKLSKASAEEAVGAAAMHKQVAGAAR